MPQQETNLYELRLTPYVFDVLVSVSYLPSRIGALREGWVDALGLAPGLRVLEFGCGTGGITRRLVARGAEVTAVDRSPTMLRHARRRAPGATFVESAADGFSAEQPFDRALLANFLHEQTSEGRLACLRAARRALVDGGRLVVVDVGRPSSGLGRRLWRDYLGAFEPPSVLEVVDGALEREIPKAGFRIERSEPCAGGRLRMHVASILAA